MSDMKMIKGIVSFIMTIIMILMPIYCFASESEVEINESLSPRYAIEADVSPVLRISESSAKASVNLSVDKGTADKAEIRVVLERKIDTGYMVEKTWRDQTVTFSSAGSVSWSKSHALKTKGTYRIRVSGILYKNGTEVGSFTDETSSMVVY